MTIRTFHARLMACYALKLQQGQEMSRALALGVGRLFSEDGAKQMDDAMAEAIATIRAQAAAVMSGKSLDKETMDRVGVEAREKAREVSPEEKEAQTKRLIQKLDAGMSMVTGHMIRNPALDPSSSAAATPFDLQNSSLSEVMQRLDPAKS